MSREPSRESGNPRPAGPDGSPSRRAERGMLAVLVLVVAAHLVAALWLTPAGYLGIDEVTYDLMLENAAAGRLLEVWNGYEERPSRELAIASLVVAEERLVAMPPPFYAAVTLPFYKLLGWRGAFLLSSLAFAATLAVCWLLAAELHDRAVAWTASLVLALATFLPGYAQAGWPHALSTLLVTGAVLAALRAARRERPTAWALLAGALCALATGIRLDGIFVFPALLFVTALRRPLCWRPPAAVAAGLAPGLLVLGALNERKFGTFSVFTYGVDAGYVAGTGGYLPLAVLGVLVLALAWAFAAEEEARWRRPALGTILALIAAGLLLVGAGRQLIASTWRGFLELVVDLRFLPGDVVQSAQTRTPTGAVVYGGGLKKALLQSCPYLPAAIAGLWTGLRSRRRELWVLLVPVLAYLGVYMAFAWHGGLAVNLRYWTVLLPFASILTAVSLRRLRPAPSRAALVAAAVAGAAPLAVFLLSSPPLAAAEPVLLSTPLWLAGALVVVTLAWCAAGARAGAVASRAAVALAVAGMGWAATVTHLYDLPWEAGQRTAALEAREAVAELLPRDSLLVTPFVVALRGAAKGRAVRIADPTLDGYADFAPLVRFHLAAGRPVLAALRDEIWWQLRELRVLEGLTVEPLWHGDGIVLARLSLAGAAAR